MYQKPRRPVYDADDGPRRNAPLHETDDGTMTVELPAEIPVFIVIDGYAGSGDYVLTVELAP